MVDEWLRCKHAAEAAARSFVTESFAPPPVCTFCALPGVILGKHSPHLMFHFVVETSAMIVLCVECHMRLHTRSSMPNRWRRHCEWIRRHHAQPFPSVKAYLAVSEREKHDIGHFPFKPNKDRWWESLAGNTGGQQSGD